MKVFFGPLSGCANSTPNGGAPRSGLCGLIGVSHHMQRIYELIQRASSFDFPVLIRGESGTGKELVARSIHDLGLRRHQPFIPVDCAALSPTLAESELFGHVKGAFTDALRDRTGLFVTANGGTLFLDEIGELPLTVQAKLLRALQEREIRPVGSNCQIRTNVRPIAATNRNLEVCVRERSFREDLFFRLNVLQIQVPSLRQRKSDIPLLIDHFLEKSRSMQPALRRFSEDAMARIAAYDWPGNVRELQNAVEHAIVMSNNTTMEIRDLPAAVAGASSKQLEVVPVIPLREAEKRAIFMALDETCGDKMCAARILGIGKTTLYRKLKEYEHQDSAAELGES